MRHDRQDHYFYGTFFPEQRSRGVKKDRKSWVCLSVSKQNTVHSRLEAKADYIIDTQIPNSHKSKGTQVTSQNHEPDDLFSLTEFTGINTDSS